MSSEAARLVKAAAEPLPDVSDPSFGEYFDRYASSRIVCIGDGSHGTSEFYAARAAITKRLIEHHGFKVIALEADWPDAAAIDRYVRHKPPAPSPVTGKRSDTFERFPTWMWKNTDGKSAITNHPDD
jgi:erythromycin esterase-like protein